MEDDVKELETQNSRIKIEFTQLKNELAQLRTQAPAAPFQTDPVREWKRKACKEVLGLTAPAGKAPLVKARANHSYNCYDSLQIV